MWGSERLFKAVFAFAALEVGAVICAEELAVTKDNAPVKIPVEKNSGEKKEPLKNDADKQGADQQNARNKGDQKKEDGKKPVAQPLNLKVLAAPLNLLIGRPEVNFEAREGAVLLEGAVVGENADNPNDAMFLQMMQQLRPVYSSELGFTRLMLPDLTPDQRTQIKAPAFAALKESAKTIAAQQNQQRRGGMGRANKQTEPRAMIRQAILKAVQETVSKEQQSLFEVELNKRIERRKNAAILSLVSMIDQQMFLTAEQRDAIIDSISTKWQDDWEKWTKMSQMYGDRYFPQVPDNLVVPHLNAEQKTVWRGVQKIEIGWWWGGEQGTDPDSDGWWGPDEPQAEGKTKKPANGLLQFNNGVLELFKK